MKHYIQYPITLDCSLSCPYCFLNNDREKWGLGGPTFKVTDYTKWRDTHLSDSEEIIVHFAGGEPFTDINIDRIVEFLDNTTIEQIDLLTNGINPICNYATLIPYKDRIKRIGLTFHRKVIGSDYKLIGRFNNTVMFLKEQGFNVYVKELLFPDEIDKTIAYQYYWNVVGVDFKIQDFKGYQGGEDFTEFKQYTPEQFKLIDEEYIKDSIECYCLKGYKNLIIRGGWSDGDILACWKDPTVVGNILENTYNPNYHIIRNRDGVNVIGQPKLYRGEYYKDRYYLELQRTESYTIDTYKDKINMRLPNRFIFEPQYMDSFLKLFDLEFDTDISEELVKTLHTIESTKKKLYDKRDEIALKYAKRDFNGDVIYNGNIPEFKNEESTGLFLKESNEIISDSFEIPLSKKIKLPKGKIQPKDILNLIDIIDL